MRFLLAFLTLSLSCFAASHEDFRPYARALINDDSAARNAALGHLFQISDLHVQLALALKSQSPGEALLVIRTLHDTNLTGSVLSLVKHHPSNEALETLQSLMMPSNKERIAAVAKEVLSHRGLTPGQAIIALDILGTAKEPIAHALVQKLFKVNNNELKIAVISYAGALLGTSKGAPYLYLISRAMHSPAFQLRMSALDVVENLPQPQYVKLGRELTACASDPTPQVRARCMQVRTSHNVGRAIGSVGPGGVKR